MLDPNPSIESLVQEASAQFETHYGKKPTIFAAAPGRVNLIGEHIDYCDGFVLPFAIERTIIIAAAPNDTEEARILTAFDNAPAVIPVQVPQTTASPTWANYIRGVIQGFRDLDHKEIPGFDAFILSSVPGGAGLSSSAALECATATLLEGLLGITLETKTKALLAQKAEHDFANVPCGIMDQFASAFGQDGQLILIDCQSGEPELVPFSNPELTVLISNTKVSHELSDGGYAARRRNTEDGLKAIGKASWRDVTVEDLESAKDKMDEVTFRRSRHVIGEIARTISAAEALRKDDFDVLGPLMYASHESLKDDFEVSCDELDILVDIAAGIGTEGGVIGARMTGGGFGGSTVTLCRADQAEKIAQSLSEGYEAKTGITPQIFASRPGAGARLL